MTDSTPVAEETQAPTIGRHVIFRSRTGDFDIPAIVTATEDSVDPEGVDKGNVPQLSGNRCVHLTVFTPQKPGTGTADDDVNPHGASENVAGCYQEWDIGEASDYESPEPGSWRWPVID